MQGYQAYPPHTAAETQLWHRSVRPGAQNNPEEPPLFPLSSGNLQYNNFAQLFNAQGFGTIRRARELYRRLYQRDATLSRTVMVFQVDSQQESRSGSLTTYYVASSVPIHLTQKPRNWRKDYKSPSSKARVEGLKRYLDKISLLFKHRTFGHYTPNPLIAYRAFRSSSVIYDLRSPFPNAVPPEHWNLQMPAQLATSPPAQRLVIWHRRLPWRITIEASGPTVGVTLEDVFTGIYNQLRQQIGHHEYYTVELTSEDRDMLTAVFEARCAGNPQDVVGGVRRVDFLGRGVYFVGLAKCRDGRWELKTSENGRRRIVLD
ncbi:hypothetical protein D9613_009259 [Agrocybe pediades]|uniref:DUF6699 domain-containing protein n=1 Tax=Agrocybe pediades TaxID=84607 RepID=A0A8H4R4J2_9AGAR|nr:hypothetical protein D9613_009259 [Agrocybe pediades]